MTTKTTQQLAADKIRKLKLELKRDLIEKAIARAAENPLPDWTTFNK